MPDAAMPTNGSQQHTSPSGLTARQAADRLAAEGANVLPRPDSRTFLRIVIETVREPMFALLLSAGGILSAAGRHQGGADFVPVACTSVGIAVIQEAWYRACPGQPPRSDKSTRAGDPRRGRDAGGRCRRGAWRPDRGGRRRSLPADRNLLIGAHDPMTDEVAARLANRCECARSCHLTRQHRPAWRRCVARYDSMRRPPRDPEEPLFSRGQMALSLAQGGLVLVFVAALFVVALHQGPPEPDARALTFAALLATNFGLVLASLPGRRVNDRAAARNAALWSVSGATAAVLAAVVAFPLARELFGLGRPCDDVALAVAVGAIVLITLNLIERISPDCRRHGSHDLIY